MFNKYGRQYWWPGDTPWEICVGAVLTQNTNWENVEKAIRNIKKVNAMSPREIYYMPERKLEELLRPSGYFRLKTQRLRNVTRWWLDSVDEHSRLQSGLSLDCVRESLLSVKGVGPETADSILLYSFNMPTFVIDKYTRRIMSRHCGTPEEIDYHRLREIFMGSLPNETELFNEYHALFVRNGKLDCNSKGCGRDCPLRALNLI